MLRARWFIPLCLFLVLPITRCSDPAPPTDVQREWLDVLAVKQEYLHQKERTPETEIAAKQAWVDAVAHFLERHPEHARAREVYHAAELDFARTLCHRGRYEEAIPYYRSALSDAPENDPLRDELAEAERLASVGPAELEAVLAGMSRHEVTALLGIPRPEWTRSITRGDKVTECWYYRSEKDGLASVCFFEGRVLATDYAAPRATPVDGQAR